MYNQYSPYGYYNYQYPPYGNQVFQKPKTSLFKNGMTSNLPKPKWNWNQFLNNTQRTLGIINQAIPIVYQIRPILTNAKTMFRIASAIEDVATVDTAQKKVQSEGKEEDTNLQQKNGNYPQFFL